MCWYNLEKLYYICNLKSSKYMVENKKIQSDSKLSVILSSADLFENRECDVDGEIKLMIYY